MILDILGTGYECIEVERDSDPRLCDCDGYCDPYIKKIVVANRPALAEKSDPPETLAAFLAQTYRHEISHAFLFESGLRDYATDETLADWLAWQLPKLVDALRQLYME